MISISSEKNKLIFFEKIETFFEKMWSLNKYFVPVFFVLSKGLYVNNADGNKR
jgi:hypothetical protein